MSAKNTVTTPEISFYTECPTTPTGTKDCKKENGIDKCTYTKGYKDFGETNN